MIRGVKDLLPDQRAAIESLLGRPISGDEQISIRTLPLPQAPEWLKSMQQDAERNKLDILTMSEIDSEIAEARRARREATQHSGE
jgi:hypothetical protein